MLPRGRRQNKAQGDRIRSQRLSGDRSDRILSDADHRFSGSAMKQIALVIEYDGVLSGWQRQKNAPSIQETIEEAIRAITGEEVKLTASGRTDAGVHALCQVASFFSETTIPTERLPHAINSRLPQTMAVQEALEVPLDFHPRHDARQKTYLYRIYNAPVRSPRERRYAAHERIPLDLSKMREQAEKLVGEHDFTSFCSSGSEVENKVRRIYDIEVREESRCSGASSSKVIAIEVTGSGFLYNMVRIIAGTLMEIGKGKALDIEKILEGKDRRLAGPTAPPQGLFLKQVDYGERLF